MVGVHADQIADLFGIAASAPDLRGAACCTVESRRLFDEPNESAAAVAVCLSCCPVQAKCQAYYETHPKPAGMVVGGIPLPPKVKPLAGQVA